MQCPNGYHHYCKASASYPLHYRARLPPSPLVLSISSSADELGNRRGLPGSTTQKIDLPANAKSITSTANPIVKHCVKLRQSSSYRHTHGSAVVVGTIPIREIYEFDTLKQDRSSMLDYIFVLDGADVPEGLNDCPVRVIHSSAAVMKKLSGLQSTESADAIAVMRIPGSFLNLENTLLETDPKGWFPCPHRLLVLEGIQDPGNLGTLLRSAMAFRWGGAFLLPGCCDPFNEKAVRASRGASFQLPIVSGSWVHLSALRNEFKMTMLAGHPDTSSDMTSKHVSSLSLSQGLVDFLADKHVLLVLGTEGIGLSEKSMQSCELVSIPMAQHFQSLNVAVAGGIFLFMLRP
ncbi:hypothetical protein Dimus_017523 [Dionaea muscipula]